jgi:D-alanyl-D-alanine carboxypeptidase
LHLPFRIPGFVVLVLALASLTTAPALAAKHRAVHHKARHHARAVSPTYPDKDAALIVDGATGKVLYARNEDAERHPASLTKMMTLYLLFEALKAGKLTMQTPMPVSRHAAAQKPTKLYLKPGETISVETAIRAIVVRSANDVAVVIAEALGGTESHFAEMMTRKARQFGMKETNYHNASGLPDPLQISTASDLAVLARHLAYDYPQYFHYFALPGFTYKGTWYPTHDNLIGHYEGADGIKTGYIGASGFNLVSSVVRDGVHILGVVMGGRTAARRDREMMRLLDQTFAQIKDNPTLVARASVPWKQVAQQSPALAGFSLVPPAGMPGGADHFAALSALPSGEPDEDAAESAPDPDFPAPKPVARAAPAPVLKGPVPAVRPAPRPGSAAEAQIASAPASPKTPAVAPVRLASAAPPVRPQMRPSLRAMSGEGDAEPAGHNWTIQIGAYADRALARAQLASYADKSGEVLAKASRIIAPIRSADGHTLYRARFGLFAEQEARAVCGRLTQRGQTCFAAVQTR